MTPVGGHDGLLDDGQAAGTPRRVGRRRRLAVAQDGEGAAAHAGDDVLAAHGGAQPAADLGHHGA